MFTKQVSQLTYADILDLVSIRNEREGQHLDFKLEIGNPEKAKKELAKDVSSFANTSGGYLILGVDKNYNIVGTEKTVQNKSIDEWINQILNSNLEPSVFYFDPRIISIPNSEKVIVVIHVPESTKKPHIVTEWNNYHVRLNDSSRSANHNQIKDMFEFSRNRTDEFNNFLDKRNLLDEDAEDFGLNKNSRILYNDIQAKQNMPKPFVLFSLIPKYPNENKINLSAEQLRIWLEQNAAGYAPAIQHHLYYPGHSNNEISLNGIVIKRRDSNKNLLSYFEIENNGFVEAGHSASITWIGDSNQNKFGISLTRIIGYEMLMLGFAKKVYELAKYYDEVLFQLSFVNVLNGKLYGFHSMYNETYRYDRAPISNKHNNNFKLILRFNPQTLSYGEIVSIAKNHSEKICRAFGLERDFCFVNDHLDINQLNDFYR